MATQSVPSFRTISRAPTFPVLRRGTASRRFPSPPIAGPSRQREEKQVQDRQKLLVDTLPLVKRIAFKIREHLPAHVEMDELIANGVLGLVDAIAKFDERKRVKLESYARHRIRGGILDGLRNADPASRDLRRKTRKIQKLSRELEVKFGRTVKDEEIATHWEWIWRNGTGRSVRFSPCVLTELCAPFRQGRPTCPPADGLGRRFWRITVPIPLLSATIANSEKFSLARFPACGSVSSKSSPSTTSGS